MNALGVILGGGAGSRLQPLTRDRAKPAVPIGGKYRLVDIPLSNCIHSHMRRIFLLTQYNSVSLHQHIQSSYRFDQFHRNFVRILAAQQTPDSEAWYLGTADAVRQTYRYFVDELPDLIVILSGDQLYRMDFREVIEQHLEKKADVTIATKPVERSEAGELGIMQVGEDRRIINFVEKPGNGPELDPLAAPMYRDERYLASMGIYVFNADVLARMIDDESKSDFGKHIIPEAIHHSNVFSFIFDGFWRDIGTVGSFWDTNLALTDPVPPFDFYDTGAPIYTHMRHLPPSKINHCNIDRALVTEGCIISGSRLEHTIAGIRAIVGEGSVIRDSVVMGADYYDTAVRAAQSGIPVGIGQDCLIERAIIDKNARIGDGVRISPDGKEEGQSTEEYTVRDGIIVIPKNAVIPAGTVL